MHWHRRGLRDALWSGAVAFVVIVGGVAISQLGRPWYACWWAWLFPLLGGALISWMSHGETIAAGSDWLRYRSWVDLYRLIEINLRRDSTIVLVLMDWEGRATHIDLQTLQGHSDIWALVHLGMRHSIADGIATEVGPAAVRALHLPSPNPTTDARARHWELVRRRGQHPVHRRARWIIGMLGALIAGFGALLAADSGDADPGGTVAVLVFGLLVVVAGAAMLIWSIRRSMLLRRTH